MVSPTASVEALDQSAPSADAPELNMFGTGPFSGSGSNQLPSTISGGRDANGENFAHVHATAHDMNSDEAAKRMNVDHRMSCWLTTLTLSCEPYVERFSSLVASSRRVRSCVLLAGILPRDRRTARNVDRPTAEEEQAEGA
ncbi:MAG: hypothetical protein U0572_00305 [Phycisphaerales bacterium]